MINSSQVTQPTQTPQTKSVKQLIQEEYIKCAADPYHFMSKYCYVQHIKRGKVLFNLYPFQQDVLSQLQKNQYNIILKSRQLGISTLVAGYSLWMMTFGTDKNILVIAIKQEVAKNLVTKVRVMHENLPSWLKNQCVEDNKLMLRFKNGSQIKALASSPEAGRSETLSLLIIDEAAFVADIDKIWGAAQQTLNTGGDAIILSTPNGVGGFFHKTWVTSEEKGKDALFNFNTIKLDWRVHPEHDQKWRDTQDEILGVDLAAQECDASFISSGNSVVPAHIIEWYEQTYTCEPIEKRGIENAFWIWQYPDYSRTYVACADVSRGDSTDFSTLQILDVETLEQVAEYKGKMATKEFGNFCVSAATEYNNALLVIENANIGWAVLQEAIDKGYQNLFYSSKDLTLVDSTVSLKKRYDLKEKSQLTAGFTTTMKTKPLIISKMDEYLRTKSVIIRSKRLTNELYTYIFNNSKTEAMQGYNDDLVMAYAIAAWVRDTAIRLKNEGIEMQKNALLHINKTAPIYKPNEPKNNQWKWTIRGESEDLTWLI